VSDVLLRNYERKRSFMESHRLWQQLWKTREVQMCYWCGKIRVLVKWNIPIKTRINKQFAWISKQLDSTKSEYSTLVYIVAKMAALKLIKLYCVLPFTFSVAPGVDDDAIVLSEVYFRKSCWWNSLTIVQSSKKHETHWKAIQNNDWIASIKRNSFTRKKETQWS